ncbi:MAG: type II secretion system protein GspL [Pseudomonadota bacterium]
MSDRLFVLLGDSPAAPIIWLRVEADGRLAMRGRAPDYAQFAANPPVVEGAFIALLPGELTALRLLPTPPRGQTQFLSAARYLLEDSLAEDIETLHVSVARHGGIAARNAGNTGRCLAVADDIMAEWVAAFRETGLTPDLLTADYFALPQRAQMSPQKSPDERSTPANDDAAAPNDEDDAPRLGVTLFVHEDGLLAHGPQGGVSIDRLTADAVLQPLLDQWSPDHIDLYAEVCPAFLQNHPSLTLHRGADIGALARLAHEAFAVRGAIPNLLTGDYGRKTDWRAAILPWRGAAAAAGLFVFALTGSWLAEGWRTEKETARLARLTSEIHNAAFPQKGNEDPIAHARRVLAARGSGVDFKSLWVGFSGAVDGRQGVQVEHFRFVNGGRSLQVGILVESISTLDDLKAALADNGIRAQEGAMNRTSGGLFSGELTVGA